MCCSTSRLIADASSSTSADWPIAHGVASPRLYRACWNCQKRNGSNGNSRGTPIRPRSLPRTFPPPVGLSPLPVRPPGTASWILSATRTTTEAAFKRKLTHFCSQHLRTGPARWFQWWCAIRIYFTPWHWQVYWTTKGLKAYNMLHSWQNSGIHIKTRKTCQTEHKAYYEAVLITWS